MDKLYLFECEWAMALLIDDSVLIGSVQREEDKNLFQIRAK